MKLELKDASMPEGTEYHVNDLGTFINGKVTDFSDGQVAFFETAQGRTIQEAFAGSSTIRIVEGKALKVTEEVNDSSP